MIFKIFESVRGFLYNWFGKRFVEAKYNETNIHLTVNDSALSLFNDNHTNNTLITVSTIYSLISAT